MNTYPGFRKFRFLSAIISFLTMVFIFGCSGSDGGAGDGNGSADDVTIEEPATFASWESLETYLKEEYAASVLASGSYGSAFFELDGAAPAPRGEFSETNVQEAGVDEADKVKTDGNYLYVVDDQAVRIVEAVPVDSMRLVSTIDVDGEVVDLYLYEDVLVILYLPEGGHGSVWRGTGLIGNTMIGIPYWIPVNSEIGVLIVHVGDPTSPEWIEETTIEGWLVSSRVTAGKLHVIQQFLPDLPPLELTYSGTDEERDTVIARNEQALESVSLDELIPHYEIRDEQGDIVENDRLVMPEDFFCPPIPGGGSIVTITTFDLNDPTSPFQSVGMVADTHTVYASTRALYLATTQFNYDTADMSDRYRTDLHKFTLTEEEVMLIGSGNVRGTILNQFSLGEYEDVLRIATTTGDSWDGTASNHVYCLDVVDGNLEVIGSLEGLAPGETIYSARFIGPCGFLVTFVQVDPLFTLDLSDPTAPEVVGELKVPGYSDYIHPLGDDHLITIGKHTEEYQGTAYYQGMQLSIFDISVFSDPRLLHKEVIGDRGTDSEALHEHKAFTFWAENDLLAIPVRLYEHDTVPPYPYSYGTHTYTGLYVYRVTVEEGFDFLGRINTDPETSWYDSYNDWLRGIFIEENVYAVNNEAVRSADLEDIGATVKTLIIPDGHPFTLVDDINDVDTGAPYDIQSARMFGDIIEICVQYAGGCEEHLFELFAENFFMESNPVQSAVKLSHGNQGDLCEAAITECLAFDLTPLKSLYSDHYQVSEGTILIQLEGFPEPIEYTFKS